MKNHLEIISMLSIVAVVLIVSVAMNNGFNIENIRGITGNVIGIESETPEPIIINDIALVNVETNPPSPIIGEQFEIIITVQNKGDETIKTPFYNLIEVYSEADDKPIISKQVVISKILAPDEKATAKFNVAMITNEGKIRILTKADSTNKLKDYNPSNNKRSKTITITS